MENMSYIRNQLAELKLQGMLGAVDTVLDGTLEKGTGTNHALVKLLQAESDYRTEKLVARRVRNSKLKGRPSLEDFDFAVKRSISRSQVEELYDLDWVSRKRSILIIGQTGVGKTFLAEALGHHACLHRYTVLFMTISNYLEEQHLSRLLNKYLKFRDRLARTDLLILDDFGLKKLDAEEGHDFNDLLKERAGKSTVITTQLPTTNWGEVFEDPVIADTVIDQLIHTSIKLIIKGSSYREVEGKKLNERRKK